MSTKTTTVKMSFFVKIYDGKIMKKGIDIVSKNVHNKKTIIVHSGQIDSKFLFVLKRTSGRIDPKFKTM